MPNRAKSKLHVRKIIDQAVRESRPLGVQVAPSGANITQTAAPVNVVGCTYAGSDGFTVHPAFYGIDHYNDPHAVYFSSGIKPHYNY